MGYILVSLYTLFLIYIGFFYIEWGDMSIYSFTKVILLILFFSIQLFIQGNYYKNILKREVDSAYNFSLKLCTGLYGIIMLVVFILIPKVGGIHNLTLVFLITLIYITIAYAILKAAIKKEFEDSNLNKTKLSKKDGGI